MAPHRGSGCRWKFPINDFNKLHRQFTLRREGYDRITTSIAALAGIIAGRPGIDDAKTAKALTFVAMCFGPLSWVSGIYSMEAFGPDGRFFWQYWVTAVPDDACGLGSVFSLEIQLEWWAGENKTDAIVLIIYYTNASMYSVAQ
ncbi:hypothetical protein QBC34DRAFT_385485 [Podospora aff. communis PSN243]|uniref:Uncharacterized protein n=1 Tax=Podospora aff. communis PSN243 TaxID=3040156 RepID=A0AAV9G854_9PEZI|nr:hypothetical protein QBC34DRAFT_385485 [Podospora aff. communis PSN243]